MTDSIVRGEKFDHGLPITEIASRVRSSIKAAVKAGNVPAFKYSVRVSKYSGGQSLRISIEIPPGTEYRSAEWLDRNAKAGTWHVAKPYREDVQKAYDFCESEFRAYNFDGSDIQSDYFHVNYYGGVSVQAGI